ncbi:hypothetical protein [Blastomonas sp.]|uniref:hypothetical protein n=1 Tax=Blastomonas sp. TaxID=1909299 RepID=UPI0035937EC1
MLGLLAQKGLGLLSRVVEEPSPERARLLGLLGALVDECDSESAALDDQPLMPGRYYSVARAASLGHYRIEPERIAERILRH